MFTFTVRIEIESPLEEVFAFAGDYRNDVRWRKGVIGIEHEPPGLPTVGTVTRELMLLFGKRSMTIARVTEYEFGKRTAFEALAGPMMCCGYREFEQTEFGTRLTYSLTLLPTGLQAISSFFYQPVFKNYARRDLERLKAILEQERVSIEATEG